MVGVNSTWGRAVSMGSYLTGTNSIPLKDRNSFDQSTTDMSVLVHNTLSTVYNSFDQSTSDMSVLVHNTVSTVYKLDNTMTSPSAGDESLVKLLVSVIISCILSGLAGLLGIATNLICVAVFWRQGFNDHVNITLLGLALSDLCCSLTMFWSAVGHTVNNSKPPPFLFEPFSLLVMTGTFPRLIFTRVTSWLTALIALERCVCVALPFRIKVIFNSRNSSLMTSGVFFVVFTSHLLIYYSRTFKMVYDPRLNMSQVIMVTIQERVNDSFYINAIIFIFLPLFNYIFILFCTLVMLWRLKMSTKWRATAQAGTTDLRKKEMSAENQQNMWGRLESRNLGVCKLDVSKENRLTKMIATTTSVFIACSTLSNISLAITLFVSGLQSTEETSLVYITMHKFGFLMETINSSVGLFVYYHQSSKFKSSLLLMIPTLKKDAP